MPETLESITTEVHALLPDVLRRTEHSAWSRARGGGPLHSFLEGPAFDRDGNLYCVDVCHGRIFRVSTNGEWDVFAQYDGTPNGLAVHRDGRLFVADAQLGLLVFDSASGRRLERIEGMGSSRFRGLNDLCFASDGTLLFTDPGTSALEDPHGRVFCMAPGGRIELLLDRLPFPNGLALTPDQDHFLLASTRSQQVLRARWNDGRLFNLGVFVSLSGGLAGPDGLAMADDGSFAVAHSGLGTVWLFSPLGEPVARIRSCAGIRTTNLAFGVDDPYSLFITESGQGVVLRARVPVRGQRLFSHG